MIRVALEGILIPFLGTALGAACVFFMRRELHRAVPRAAARGSYGVMRPAAGKPAAGRYVFAARTGGKSYEPRGFPRAAFW